MTLGSFLYFLFVDIWVWIVCISLSAWTLGLTGMFLVPYWFTSRFAMNFFWLYMDNNIYEAFYPVVAPEMMEGAV